MVKYYQIKSLLAILLACFPQPARALPPLLFVYNWSNMGFKGLAKKAGILALLLVAMAAVYLVKNDGTREMLLGNLELVISKFAFANRNMINLGEITFSEIDIDALEGNDKPETARADEPERAEKAEDAVRQEEAEGPEELKRIEKEIQRIARETDELEARVNELAVLREINEQVEDIAEKLAEITEGIKIASAVSEAYPISSI